MKAFGSINAGPWALVEQLGSGTSGKSRLAYPDGLVVSVQPDGSLETRPAGTDGAWEQCTIDGGIAVYAGTGKAWPFGIRNA